MGKKVTPSHGRGKVNQFNKGESGNPKGRPKKAFSALATQFKALGYESATPVRIREAYELLLGLPLRSVIEIAGTPRDTESEKDNDYPAILRIVASEMIGKRRFEMVREMLDRTIGKPKQDIDLSGGQPAKITIEIGGELTRPVTKEQDIDPDV